MNKLDKLRLQYKNTTNETERSRLKKKAWVFKRWNVSSGKEIEKMLKEYFKENSKKELDIVDEAEKLFK